jgi:hypothetical protein
MRLAIISMLIFSLSAPVYASDWDTVGKIFAGIEGVRILTGDRVDIIGTITGIKGDGHHKHRDSRRHKDRHTSHVYVYQDSCPKVWVPQVVWKRKYIPEHTEYDPRYGEIIVEGHYIKYQVQEGGYWSYYCPRRDGHYYYSSRYRR